MGNFTAMAKPQLVPDGEQVGEEDVMRTFVGIKAQHAKPVLAVPASYTRASVQVLAALLLIQQPALPPGKGTDGGPRTSAPAPCRRPGLGLAGEAI